jgi:hypothetical protein
MTTLFIPLGALILAVVGCAILDPRPARATKRRRGMHVNDNRV